MPLDDVLIRPKHRGFMVGSTGSGKSTLAAALLERYHERFPVHNIVIVDPKKRFVSVEPDERGADPRVFPEGFKERNHGRRDGVAVCGEVLPHPSSLDPGEVVILQDARVIVEAFTYLYKYSDVRQPVLLYLDESFDFVRGTRADPSLRRLLQQGREIGVGCLIINQRPSWIDKAMLTEADQIFIGSLNHPDDSDTMSRIVADPRRRVEVKQGTPQHTWIYADQHSRSSIRFRLEIHGNDGNKQRGNPGTLESPEGRAREAR